MNTATSKHKYQIISDQLKAQIESKIFKPGDLLPTENALASEYGVSRLTVRQALKELAQKQVVKSIQGKGTFVAKNKPMTRVELKTVHFITSTVHKEYESDPLLEQMFMEFSRSLSRQGWSLTVSLLGQDETLSGFIAKHGIPPTFRKGLIITTIKYTQKDLDLLEDEGIPYVILPSASYDIGSPMVGTDDYKGMIQCMDYLLKYGHRKIAFLICQPTCHAYNLLLDGYLDSLKEANIDFDPNLVVATTPWGEDEGRNSMQLLLDRKTEFTAVIIFGDRATVGSVRFMLDRGISIPGDISVMIYDRYHWLDSVFPFKLSGVEQNVARICSTVLDMLERQQSAGKVIQKKIMIEPELSTGGTCQCIFEN